MKTMYVCEKCGKQFDTYEECCACENSHLIPEGIVHNCDAVPAPTYTTGGTFPDTVVVSFQKLDECGCMMYEENDDGDRDYLYEYAEYTLVRKTRKESKSFSASIDTSVRDAQRKSREEYREWKKQWDAEHPKTDAE